ncbi:MAG: RrF2 family transcriptional regulator [Agrobacterium albertimagni]|nr:Rrf2 family transcriptional regulator [Amphiplicatus sp.]
MRLNVQSDYALRLLMHLAVNDDALVTIAEIASRFDISRAHLMKVAHILGQEGLIETVRGRSGGLRLARSAQDVSVGAVVRRMEGDFALVECFQGGKGECLITPACKLKGVLHEAMVAFLAVLDQYTIHDLVTRNSGLKKLLAFEAA